MPENDNIDTEEENVSFHCVQDGQKGMRKKSEMLKEVPVECSK